MKKIIFVLVMLVSTTLQAADHKGYSIGVTTSEVSGDEGSGLFVTTPYFFDDSVSLKLRIAEAFLEGQVSGGGTNWHSYKIVNVGAMLLLMESESMNIYFEGGLNYMPENKTLGSDSSIGRYGHIGFEWFLNKKWVDCCSAFVELGTTGKGDKATNAAGNPSVGHGYVTTVGLRYFFGE